MYSHFYRNWKQHWFAGLMLDEDTSQGCTDNHPKFRNPFSKCLSWKKRKILWHPKRFSLWGLKEVDASSAADADIIGIGEQRRSSRLQSSPADPRGAAVLSPTDINEGQADHHWWLYSQTLHHDCPEISTGMLSSHLNVSHFILQSCCVNIHLYFYKFSSELFRWQWLHSFRHFSPNDLCFINFLPVSSASNMSQWVVAACWSV